MAQWLAVQCAPDQAWAHHSLMSCQVCRCRGVPVEVQQFEDDTHALGKPQTAFHQWLRTIAFFKIHAAPNE